MFAFEICDVQFPTRDYFDVINDEMQRHEKISKFMLVTVKEVLPCKNF